MIQTGLIQDAHSDLVTDASYDFYGLRLATCSLDQRIKIWNLDESNGTWSVEDDWKAHDAAVSKVSWAHPEFGSIVASSSFDRTVKVWERRSLNAQTSPPQSGVNGGNTAPPPTPSAAPSPSSSRWVEMAMLTEARGTVRAVEFAPHHFGLKMASISSDNFLRIYECLDLKTWQASEEIDVLHLPSASSPTSLSHAHTLALATPTQTSATLEGASASLVAQALQQTQGLAPQSRPGMGNREADGGWCISWCKDRYWGEILAAGCGIGGTVRIIQLSPSKRPTTILTLDPSPSSSTSLESTIMATESTDTPSPYAITSIAWAPSCGRSYHLIATGGRDGHVRIWRVKPAEEGQDGDAVEEAEEKWTGSVVADFDHHKSAVGRVEWNITGTVLSSAGNDGRIRLWKATIGNVWRPSGSIGVEQAEEQHQADVDMDEDAVVE